MHRTALWTCSAVTAVVLAALIVYQLQIGTGYLPPLSLTGSGSTRGPGGAQPTMSRIATICKQFAQHPQSGFPGG